MARASAQTKGLETSASRFSKTAKAGFMVVGAAVLKATADFIRFETTMTRLQTLAGATEGEVRTLSKAVLDMAGPLATSPQALAEGLYFVYSAGIKGAAAMETLEFAAKGAAIGMGTVETVADATTSVLNAYGTEAISAGEATAILREAVEQSKREADEMAESIGRVLPIAAEMGVEFEQVAGAMAAMTRTGLDASEAATALRGILVGILDPTERAEKMMAEYGLSVEQLQGAIRSGNMVDVLLQLKDAFGENERALSILFPNVRALVGALNLVGDNADSAREAFQNVAEATVSDLNAAFETFADTTEGRVRAAWAYLQSALIQFGSSIAPVVAVLANLVAAIAPLLRYLLPMALAWTAVRIAAAAIPAVMTAVSGGLTTASVALVRFQVLLNMSRLGMIGFGTAVGTGARGLLNAIPATAAWTASLILATIAIQKVMGYMQDMKQRSDEISDSALSGTHTLQEWQDAIEEVGTEWHNTLGIMKPFNDAVEDVKTAIDDQNKEILAGTDLYKEWGGTATSALGDITNQNLRLHGSVAELLLRLKAQGVELDRTTAATVREKMAAGDLEGVIRLLSGALGIGKSETDGYAAATNYFADAQFRATEATKARKAAEDALAGGLLGLLSSLKGVRDAQSTINDLVKDGKKGSQEYRDAQAGLLGAQLTLNQSFKDYVGDLKLSDLTQRQAREKIFALGRQVGLTKAEVVKILGPLAQYKGILDKINRQKNITTTVTTIFKTSGNAPPGYDPRQVYDHQGGFVNRHRGGAIERLHSGGVPQLRSDERASILQVGEFVIQKRSVEALGVPLLKALNSGRVHRLSTPGHGLGKAEAYANALALSRRERGEMRIVVRPDRRRMGRDLGSDYVRSGR